MELSIFVRTSCRAGIARRVSTPMVRSIIFTMSWPPASSSPARIGFCLCDRNSSSHRKITKSRIAKAALCAAGSNRTGLVTARSIPFISAMTSTRNNRSARRFWLSARTVGAHFLFVCKPDSHKTIGEYLTGVEVPSLVRIIKRGKQRFTYAWRWMSGVPIRDGKDALEANWLEITIRDPSGKVTYRNSFITDLEVNAGNVEDLAAAGRARWKIENETFNTLKTKGYNLEHNFGHGKNNLSAVLVTLNLIAFAIHRAAELADQTWIAAIEAAGARVRFFANLRALTAYLLFPSWDSLLKTLAFQAKPPLPS